jgi:hypothetical protein
MPHTEAGGVEETGEEPDEGLDVVEEPWEIVELWLQRERLNFLVRKILWVGRGCQRLTQSMSL